MRAAQRRLLKRALDSLELSNRAGGNEQELRELRSAVRDVIAILMQLLDDNKTYSQPELELAHFREALKMLYPPPHPLHDPERTFSREQLERLESEAFHARGWQR